MPTYVLRCAECGWKWEEQRLIRDVDAPAVCKNCGGEGKVIINFAPSLPWYPGSERVLKS